MTFFAPIFSTLVIMSLACFTVIAVKKKISLELNYCVAKMSKLQVEHKKQTKKLFALNPYAKTLRASRKAAQAAVRLAPPPFKPAAVAALNTIKLKQKALRALQKAILMKAYASSAHSFGKMSAKLYITKKFQKGLEVKPYPKNSDSPSYKLKSNYTELKTIKYTKGFDVLFFLPSSIKILFYDKPYYKIFECGSTLNVKESAPWKTKLILGKW